MSVIAPWIACYNLLNFPWVKFWCYASCLDNVFTHFTWKLFDVYQWHFHLSDGYLTIWWPRPNKYTKSTSFSWRNATTTWRKATIGHPCSRAFASAMLWNFWNHLSSIISSSKLLDNAALNLKINETYMILQSKLFHTFTHRCFQKH